MNGIRFSCQEGMSILIQIDIVDYDNLHHFTTFLKNKITYKALSGV